MKNQDNGTLGKNDHKYPKTLLQKKTTALFITIPQTTINYKELHSKIIDEKSPKYLITKLEEHKDQGQHIHLLIHDKQFRYSAIHKIIMSFNDRTDKNGLIDYKQVEHMAKSINYLKKEDTALAPPLIYGNEPTKQGRPSNNEEVLDIIKLAEDGDTELALEQLKIQEPLKYLQYKETFKTNLASENKVRKKYELPNMDKDNITLTPNQQKVWDLLQSTPKQRRIIWITGNYGSGKSFLYNYIKTNHEYGMYDAGQTASLDNIAYGYDEEGVIAWDLPRTFNFSEMGDTIANVIEKFSDFGQSITSKKYNGKTQKVRGHAIVFSNHDPINQLKHRDIIHINLSQNDEQKEVMVEEENDDYQDDTENYIKYRQQLGEQAEVLEGKYPRLFRQTNEIKHIDLSQPTSSEEEEEQIKLEPTEYAEINKAYNGTIIKYIVQYQTKQGGRIITKATDTMKEAQEYFNNNNYYKLEYND